MSEPLTKSVVREQQEQKIEPRIAVKRIAGFTIAATAVAILALLVATGFYAPDKYSLKSPSESRSPTSGGTRTGPGLFRSDR